MARGILVLYNSKDNSSAQNNIFAAGGQTVTDYLGFTARYRDMAKDDLPRPEELAGVRAVVTTFRADRMKDPEGYLSWLGEVMASGRKVVILGVLGATMSETGRRVDQELLERTWQFLGVEYRASLSTVGTQLSYAAIDKDLMGFERALPATPTYFEDIRPRDPRVRPLVSVKNASTGAVGCPAFVGPAGAFVYQDYIYWEDPLSFRRKWHIDPFAFFRAALSAEDLPAPTATTLNGRRVAFSHIDADAFNGYSNFQRDKICAEVIRDSLLTRYDFPVSVSLIVAEVAPELYGSQKNLAVARAILALPNVEPASHTYSHPFYWDAAKKDIDTKYATRHGYKIRGYTFDARQEIVGAVDWINANAAPADKPCRMLFWSGDCDPLPEQIAMADEAGILHINGGLTTMDRALNNSYFNVSPPYQPKGNRIQILTGQVNENILTNLWTKPIFGYRNIIQTMEATGAPRRISPIDIYYHFYSAQEFASVKALQDVYDWVLTQPVARIFTSHYIRMVQGAHRARIAQTGPHAFAVEDYGACTSLRFADKGLRPDLAACENVLGWTTGPDGLYVHLAPEARRAVVALAPDAPAKRPYLDSATGVLWNFHATPSSVSFRLECFSWGEVALAGLPAGRTALLLGPDRLEKRLETDGQGRLALRELISGAYEVRLQ